MGCLKILNFFFFFSWHCDWGYFDVISKCIILVRINSRVCVRTLLKWCQVSVSYMRLFYLSFVSCHVLWDSEKALSHVPSPWWSVLYQNTDLAFVTHSDSLIPNHHPLWEDYTSFKFGWKKNLLFECLLMWQVNGSGIHQDFVSSPISAQRNQSVTCEITLWKHRAGWYSTGSFVFYADVLSAAAWDQKSAAVEEHAGRRAGCSRIFSSFRALISRSFTGVEKD